MGRNKKCCQSGTLGVILISGGIGVMLAYLLPYQFLIFFFGGALVLWGIRRLCKK